MAWKELNVLVRLDHRRSGIPVIAINYLIDIELLKIHDTDGKIDL